VRGLNANTYLLAHNLQRIRPYCFSGFNFVPFAIELECGGLNLVVNSLLWKKSQTDPVAAIFMIRGPGNARFFFFFF
jgi:hypothetical protein